MKKKTKHELFCAFLPLILLILMLICFFGLVVYGIKEFFRKLKSKIAYLGLDSGKSRALSSMAKHRQRVLQAKEEFYRLFYDNYESIDSFSRIAELEETIKKETSLSDKLTQACRLLKIPNWRIKAV